jgi:hypothetical protein
MEKEQFDALAYFAELGKKNKLARKHGFKVAYCSGQGALAAVMQYYRDYQNFILVDDTTSGNTFSNKAGWFDRNVYCVHILAGYDHNDAESYNKALRLCRTIFRQFMSKMIRDKESYKFGTSLLYLHTANVYSNEYGRFSFNGTTGLFFQIQNDEAVDLTFEDSDWEE